LRIPNENVIVNLNYNFSWGKTSIADYKVARGNLVRPYVRFIIAYEVALATFTHVFMVIMCMGAPPGGEQMTRRVAEDAAAARSRM
jgi:hypothetical protein